MIRRIIKIDRDKCNGCGLCAAACHEGAIDIVGGKAVLTREHFCDGLGDCLPQCPTGAISFEEREAPAYDDAAVKASKAAADSRFGGCPGSAARELKTAAGTMNNADGASAAASFGAYRSMLNHWPVQIKLSPVNAPCFDGADLLVAADCTAYACGDFHSRFMAGRTTLIGCPKLDAVNYAEKLGAIITANDISSITVARMEVPCCGGLEAAVRRAAESSGKSIPVSVIIIPISGD